MKKHFLHSFDEKLSKQARQAVTQGESIIHEVDPLRFMLDAYLTEYDAIRREVELHIELHERNINYLLLILGAIFSLSGFNLIQKSDLFIYLNNNPYLYLLLAIISLIFPVLYIMRSNYVNTLESYQRYVLSPKIAAISSTLSTHSISAEEFIKWESDKFPDWLQGPMKGLDYGIGLKYQKYRGLFSLISTFRYLFVSLPSAFFTIVFFYNFNWSKWTYMEYIFIIALAISIFMIIAGISYTTSFYSKFTIEKFGK
jgi:hypothetical protein